MVRLSKLIEVTQLTGGHYRQGLLPSISSLVLNLQEDYYFTEKYSSISLFSNRKCPKWL